MENRFLIWPIFIDPETGECSVPDAILRAIWTRLWNEDKIRHLFWGGTVRTFEAFKDHLLSPLYKPCLVVDTVKQDVVFLAWLSDFGDGFAFGHFCAIGKYQRHAGEEILKYWRELRILIVIGITPENNGKALKLTRILGFKEVGTIPSMCNMAYEAKRVGGTITCIEL